MKKNLIFLILSVGILSSLYHYYPRKNHKLIKKKVVIAGIFQNGYQVWNMNVKNEAKKKLNNISDGEFLFYDVGLDNKRYLEALNDVIEKGVDGVLISIPNEKLSELTVKKLNDANIPVIALDHPLINSSSHYIAPWFGVDGYRVGFDNGSWLANYVKENNLIAPDIGLLILSIDNFIDMRERTHGQYESFTSKVEKFPLNSIFYSNYNGEMEDSYLLAKKVFLENPHIHRWLIMSGNEEGVIGGIKGLEEIGKDHNSIVVGIGGYLAKNEFKKKNSALKASNYYYAEDVGGKACEFLIKNILYNEPIPLKMSAFSRVITKENFIEVMGEYSN